MEKQVSISVLPPTVVNESHPLESVASKQTDENEIVDSLTALRNAIPIPDVNIDYEREDGK